MKRKDLVSDLHKRNPACHIGEPFLSLQGETAKNHIDPILGLERESTAVTFKRASEQIDPSIEALWIPLDRTY